MLFDSGSHGSFITASVVSSVGLPCVRQELLGLSTLGKKAKSSNLTDVVEAEINPLRGEIALKLETFVVPNISPIRNEHIEIVKEDYDHLKKLWFSDVCKNSDELKIDVLMGADYLWAFQKDHIV